MRVSEDYLPEGWKFKRISSKYCIWIDPHGRWYKSSMDVKATLREQGILSGSEIDTELETASEYQPSPLKKPRSTAATTTVFVLIKGPPLPKRPRGNTVFSSL